MKPTKWHVLALAVVIAIVQIAGGKWNSTTSIPALVALVLLGALFPPAGLALGGIALLRLFFTFGGQTGGAAPLLQPGALDPSTLWDKIKGLFPAASSSTASPPAGTTPPATPTPTPSNPKGLTPQ